MSDRNYNDKYRTHDTFDVPRLGDHGLNGQLALLSVGSDVALYVACDDDHGDFVIGTMDSDGNDLAGVIARARDLDMAMRLLPLAVDTAVRLLPNWLLTPALVPAKERAS